MAAKTLIIFGRKFFRWIKKSFLKSPDTPTEIVVVEETPSAIEPQDPVAEIISQPTISVDVQSDEPVQIEVRVKTKDSETLVTVDTLDTETDRSREPYDMKGYAYAGIKMSEEVRYHEYFDTATSVTLDDSEMGALLANLEFSEELCDDLYGSPDWNPPSYYQIQNYFRLRKLCEANGLLYSNAACPESGREYQQAIFALKKVLRRAQKQAQA